MRIAPSVHGSFYDDTIYGLYVGDFSNRIGYHYCLSPWKCPLNGWFLVNCCGNANLGGKHRYGVVMYDYRGFGKVQEHQETKKLWPQITMQLCCGWKIEV